MNNGSKYLVSLYWNFLMCVTENNYTANIEHYHVYGDNSNDENVSREYISKDTLEDNR